MQKEGKSEKYETSKRKLIKSAKRSENIFKMKICGIKCVLTKKNHKNKKINKLCWADQVKFEFGGHFGDQKAQKCKIVKNR